MRAGLFSKLLLSRPLSHVLGGDAYVVHVALASSNAGGLAQSLEWSVRDDADAQKAAVEIVSHMQGDKDSWNAVQEALAGSTAGCVKTASARGVVRFYVLREICIAVTQGLVEYMNEAGHDDLRRAAGPANARNTWLAENREAVSGWLGERQDLHATAAALMPRSRRGKVWFAPSNQVVRELLTAASGAMKSALSNALARSLKIAVRDICKRMKPIQRDAVAAVFAAACGATSVRAAEATIIEGGESGADADGEGTRPATSDDMAAVAPAAPEAHIDNDLIVGVTSVSRSGTVSWSHEDLTARLGFIRSSLRKSRCARSKALLAAVASLAADAKDGWTRDTGGLLCTLEREAARFHASKERTSFDDYFVAVCELSGRLQAAVVKQAKQGSSVGAVLQAAGLEPAEVIQQIAKALPWVSDTSVGKARTSFIGDHALIAKHFITDGRRVRAGLPGSFTITSRYVATWVPFREVAAHAQALLGVPSDALKGEAAFLEQDRQWFACMPGLFGEVKGTGDGHKFVLRRDRVGSRRVLVRHAGGAGRAARRAASALSPGVARVFRFCVQSSGVAAHALTGTFFPDGYKKKCAQHASLHAEMRLSPLTRIATRAVIDGAHSVRPRAAGGANYPAVGRVWAPTLARALAAAKGDGDMLEPLGLNPGNVMFVGVDPGRKDLATIVGFTVAGEHVQQHFHMSVSSMAYRTGSGTTRLTRAAAVVNATERAREVHATLADPKISPGSQKARRARAQLASLRRSSQEHAKARAARWSREREYCDFVADEIIRLCDEKGKKPLVIYGAAKFAVQQRGRASHGGGTTAPRQLLAHLQKRFLAVMMDEMYTSTACPWCQSRVERAPGMSDRWWRCPSAECASRGERFHKDATAAITIGRLFIEYMRTAAAGGHAQRPAMMTSLRRDVEKLRAAAP